MSVSDEMKAAVSTAKVWSNVAQAVVNAAWSPFREDQERTWPEDGDYLVEVMDGRCRKLSWGGEYPQEVWKHYDVIYYASFSTLMQSPDVNKGQDDGI